MNKTEYAVFVGKETIIESWAKDLVTLLTVGFLIGISIWGNSVFWTFVTGLMLLVIVSGKVNKIIGKSKRFKTKEELQTWVDSLE